MSGTTRQLPPTVKQGDDMSHGTKVDALDGLAEVAYQKYRNHRCGIEKCENNGFGHLPKECVEARSLRYLWQDAEVACQKARKAALERKRAS